MVVLDYMHGSGICSFIIYLMLLASLDVINWYDLQSELISVIDFPFAFIALVFVPLVTLPRCNFTHFWQIAWMLWTVWENAQDILQL